MYPHNPNFPTKESLTLADEHITHPEDTTRILGYHFSATSYKKEATKKQALAKLQASTAILKRKSTPGAIGIYLVNSVIQAIPRNPFPI